jgi:hypothetical protein
MKRPDGYALALGFLVLNFRRGSGESALIKAKFRNNACSEFRLFLSEVLTFTSITFSTGIVDRPLHPVSTAAPCSRHTALIENSSGAT